MPAGGAIEAAGGVVVAARRVARDAAAAAIDVAARAQLALGAAAARARAARAVEALGRALAAAAAQRGVVLASVGAGQLGVRVVRELLVGASVWRRSGTARAGCPARA